MKEMRDKRYLGDSVYVVYDGYHIVLTTENGLPTDPSNKILLEPHLLKLLNKYFEDMRRKYQEGGADG